MAIRLYRSNRTEQLVQQLVEQLSSPLPDPFAPEIIAVQGPGMERWLSMQLAQNFGICAHTTFPFPRALLERVLNAALGPASGPLHFDLTDLGWACAQVLRERQDDPELLAIHRYMERSDEHDPWLTLGMELGAVFDRYQVYRPELLLEFERAQSNDFQASLWRRVVEQVGGDHLARRAHDYLARERAGAPLLAQGPDFPRRVSLFGLSSLPPLFLRVLGALSEHCEVHLYALTPSREYWGDLTTRSRQPDAPQLLSRLGRLSRDFQDLLEETVTYAEPDADLFVDPGTDCLLHTLQSDMLHLRSRGPKGDAPPLALVSLDRSLRVHSCHSRTRELEVLRDQLRERLERDASLLPQDIVVLATDIDAYAPAIEAVFGSGDAALPFRVADRAPARSCEVLTTLMALLDVAQSRVSLSEVSDLLHKPLIHGRFALSREQVTLAVRWLEQAGARWGLDAAHRALFGQPAEHPGTLLRTLDRLLLGHGVQSEGEPLLWGVLPFDDVEAQADTLSGLTDFLHALADTTRALAAPRSAEAWANTLRDTLASLLDAPPEHAAGRQRLLNALERVAGSAQRAGCEHSLSLHSMRRQLERSLDSQRGGQGFLQQGITFCRPMPMRALPFRVVCFLGMDDESFPRRAPSISFDHVSRTPERGDRSLPDDDRHVFLEALLCARDALIITCRGRNIEDDSLRPRAAVIDQLLDVIDAGCVVADASSNLTLPFGPDGSRAEVLLHHPLWPFDPRYFDGPKDSEWFTYDPLAAQARASRAAAHTPLRPFLERALPPRPRPTTVELETLVQFFRNTARFFLRERFGVRLLDSDALLPDREPALLGGLDRFRVAEYLRSSERELPQQAERLWARGLLPLGQAGLHELSDERNLVAQLRAAAALAGESRSVRIEQRVGNVRLVGRLPEVFAAGRRELVMARLSAKHLLSFWVRQLALCAQAPHAGVLVGRVNKSDQNPQGGAEVRRFEPIAEPERHLETLLQYFCMGARTHVPFYPEASCAFARASLAGKAPADSLARAERAFHQEPARGGPPAECDTPELRQLYGQARLSHPEDAGDDPAAPAHFEHVAKQVFFPLLRALPEPS